MARENVRNDDRAHSNVVGVHTGVRRGQRAELDGTVLVGQHELRRRGPGERDHGGADAGLAGELGPHLARTVRAGGPGHGPGHAGAERGRERVRPGGRAGQPAAGVQERQLRGDHTGERGAGLGGAAGAGHRPGRAGRPDRVRRGDGERRRQLPGGPEDRRGARVGPGRPGPGRDRTRALPAGGRGHGRRSARPGDRARRGAHRRDGRERQAAEVRPGRRRGLHRLRARGDRRG